MSMTAITITSVGVLIILGRGPLLFAPAATQALYLRWLGSTLILRAYGIVILLLAAVVIWLIMHEHGTAAQLVHAFGWFFAVLCVVLLIPFPGPIGRWGAGIWQRFTPGALRGMGLLSVLVGGWLVWFGLTLSP